MAKGVSGVPVGASNKEAYLTLPMATNIPPFLLPSFLIFLCFLSSSKQGFASEHNHDIQHTHHTFQLSSLLPTPACSPPNKGSKSKATLEVVHKHGPCSQLKQDKTNAPTTHTDVLLQDQSRVKLIHSRRSKMSGDGTFVNLDSTTVPAKSGITIGSGNYIVTMGLGTPKKDLTLIFDTGSDLTWTQCQPCAGYCYKQKEPIFDPSKSSTYANISCTSSTCSQLASATGNRPRCAKLTSTCIYGLQYGDQSYSIGYFGKEILTIGANDVIDNFLFGCGENNRGLFGGAAGLLGLGRNPISFVQQTSKKYNQAFSYCLPSTSSGVGYLTFGGGASSGSIQYTPFSTISRYASFYGLSIEGITVGGTKLSIPKSIFSSSGTIIDSGTVITRLPQTAYDALKSAFKQGMSRYPEASPLSLLDTCYDLSSYQSVTIPKIGFLFGGGATVELHPSGILYVANPSHVCLAFAGNGDDQSLGIFGNVQQRTLRVMYDVGGGKVGFGTGGCK